MPFLKEIGGRSIVIETSFSSPPSADSWTAGCFRNGVFIFAPRASTVVCVSSNFSKTVFETAASTLLRVITSTAFFLIHPISLWESNRNHSRWFENSYSPKKLFLNYDIVSARAPRHVCWILYKWDYIRVYTTMRPYIKIKSTLFFFKGTMP